MSTAMGTAAPATDDLDRATVPLARGSHYSRVDGSPDPAVLVTALDEIAGRDAIRRLKQYAFAMLQISDGHHVLDVGCGTGDDVRALASMVGPAGLVVGVESSEVMLAEARRRAGAAPGLPVRFEPADARRLPFADSTFDASRAERVLQHLIDPQAAVEEMVRVTRPGGHVVVTDTDWGSAVVHGGEPGLTRRILDGFCDHFANGWSGRQLPGLFRRAGLADAILRAETITSSDLGDSDPHVCRVAAATAAEMGRVSEDEAAEWVRQVEAANQEGTFLCAVTVFAVGARKP